MEIDNEFRVVYDDTNVVLQFHEKRSKTKKDGTVETYEYTDNTYYPTLKHAIKSYLNKTLKQSTSWVDVLNRISEVELKIEQLCQKI